MRIAAARLEAARITARAPAVWPVLALDGEAEPIAPEASVVSRAAPATAGTAA
jgi:hypothetical protein